MFRPPEVVQALASYHRRLGTPLPAGTVLRCDPECQNTGSPIRVHIAIATADESAHQEVTVEGPALAAALILYCRDRGIPLPARADKSLQLFGEQVCLVATINAKRDDLPQLGHLRV
jgi:hypothetical protein